MNISYLVTVSNETDTLQNLLYRIRDCKEIEDEIVIVLDSDCVNNESTKKIVDSFKCDNTKKLTHSLEKNYSQHKNWGANQCKNPWVFQLDGDECPTEILLSNIKEIINSNPDIEAFWVSRINDFKGVTQEHAKKWGWRLTPSDTITHENLAYENSDQYKFLKTNSYIVEDTLVSDYLVNDPNLKRITYKTPLVNWPDPQCRIFKNIPDRIKWVGRLHERIEGNKNFVYLPYDEELSLYHDKTIEKQIETNLRYNTLFTQKENAGFSLPK
jgi:hypothetical protein